VKVTIREDQYGASWISSREILALLTVLDNLPLDKHLSTINACPPVMLQLTRLTGKVAERHVVRAMRWQLTVGRYTFSSSLVDGDRFELPVDPPRKYASLVSVTTQLQKEGLILPRYVCSWCKGVDRDPVPSFRRCERCKARHYCTKICQTSDWHLRHGKECSNDAT
jgi:hypothetical protein